MDYLKKIDIFAQGIHLTINKQENSQTILGGILSIVLIGLIGSMFFLNIEDVLYAKNPIIDFQEIVLSQSPNITLDQNSMPIAMALSMENNTGLYMPNYFTYRAVFSKGATNGNKLLTQDLPIKLCEKTDFPNISNATFFYLDMHTMSCVANQNITIGGSYTDSYVSYVGFNLYMCNNSTLNNNSCAPADEINDYIFNNILHWNIFLLNTEIDARLTYPLTSSVLSLSKILKAGGTKILEISIKKQDLHSDDGFILSDTNMYSSITYDEQEFDYRTMDSKNLLMEFNVFASAKQLSFYRSYTKVQTVLASVGGLANVLRTAFITICYLFSVIQRDEEILNKIFDYNVKMNQKTDQIKNENIPQINQIKKPIIFSKIEIPNKKSPEIYLFSNLEIPPNEAIKLPKNKFVRQNNNSSYTNDSNNRSNILNEFYENNLKKKEDGAKNIIKMLETRKGEYRLDFTFCEIIRAFCFCRLCQSKNLQNKKELYQNSNFVIAEFLDINYIIQKLGEIEKLKIILFNYNQIALFDFISKESIFLKSEHREKNIIGKYRELANDKEQLAKLILDFKTKINDPNNDLKNIDKKLYEMLNDEFKN